MDNLEAWQGDCCQRHPTAGGRNIMSSLVLPLPALRLSLACREFSTWATDRDLWQRIQNKTYASTGDVINQSFAPGKSTFMALNLWWKIARAELWADNLFCWSLRRGVLSPAPRQTQHFPAKINWFDPLHTGSFSGLHCVPPADTWLHFWSKSLTSLKFTKQGGHWGFIKYWPPKKKPNIDQILTTKHFIDQILTTKVP